MPHHKDNQDQEEEPKDSHHIEHDTADRVLEVTDEFVIAGDEFKEPKTDSETEADPETSSG